MPCRGRWRSPLRGPWLTSVFGSVLLVVLPIVILTGLLSYIAYGPRFGPAIPGRRRLAEAALLRLAEQPDLAVPADPGSARRPRADHDPGGAGETVVGDSAAVHLAAARSVASVLERVSLLMLVGGILFEIVTGVLNIQYDYIFGFSFYTAHYFGAWVFIAGFVAHVPLKLPTMVRGLRSRSFRGELRTSRADTGPEPLDARRSGRRRSRTRRR